MLNRSSTWQKTNFKCTFCGFSFTPISKWLENVHETFINTKHSLLKTYFSLIIEYGMYLKCLQKRVNLAALLVQNKPRAPIRRVENKVKFLERQCQSEKRSFVYKKETEYSFELSLSICVLYRRIFNLEMQNFSHIQYSIWFRAVTEISTVSKIRFTIPEFVSAGKYTNANHFLRFYIRKDFLLNLKFKRKIVKAWNVTVKNPIC